VSDVQNLLKTQLGSATTASSASQITTTLSYTKADGTASGSPSDPTNPAQVGGSVTVTATFPTLNMHFPFIPVPNNGDVTRTNVARIEDLDSTQGTCS
jgi:hypothetical protein